MASVTFSPKSRHDLLDIGDYIAKDSRVNARRFIVKLTDQCKRIGRVPMGYASREDLAPGLRMATTGRYVIYFAYLMVWFESSGYYMAHATCQSRLEAIHPFEAKLCSAFYLR